MMVESMVGYPRGQLRKTGELCKFPSVSSGLWPSGTFRDFCIPFGLPAMQAIYSIYVISFVNETNYLRRYCTDL